MNSELGIGTKAGTIGGTLLSIFGKVNLDDLLSSVILAAIGAIVSFFVSLILKRILTNYKRNNSSK